MVITVLEVVKIQEIHKVVRKAQVNAAYYKYILFRQLIRADFRVVKGRHKGLIFKFS